MLITQMNQKKKCTLKLSVVYFFFRDLLIMSNEHRNRDNTNTLFMYALISDKNNPSI